MRPVTLGVSSVEETKRRMAAAFQGEAQGEVISFASVELLWKVLTAKRWEILCVMPRPVPERDEEVDALAWMQLNAIRQINKANGHSPTIRAKEVVIRAVASSD